MQHPEDTVHFCKRLSFQARSLFVVSIILATVFLVGCRRETPEVIVESSNRIPTIQSCRTCHEDIYEAWRYSHHAFANRPVDSEKDERAFEPPSSLKHGSFESQFEKIDGRYGIVTTGNDAVERRYFPEMVLAHEPLRQFLVPFPGGRWQVTDLAWDPHKKEWFNVFGAEDRQPDEWGFWANRGMNWNAQCAYCHMTSFRKGYKLATDSYESTWAAQGIDCRQCHGAMRNHIEEVKKPEYHPPIKPASVSMDTCASCHSRREDLTGDFKAGENYHDHFRLSLPVHESLYYPDGQIRDEVFVFGSFQLSKMSQAGVTCLDCHNAHSGSLILPAENNSLCMRCHQSPGLMNATVIEPLKHSRHKDNSAGNRCVECHMPQTTYMQRDPRRDHGFLIPDPLLTREIGIPNACTRCHSDQTVDWAVEWTDRWYGEKMNRPERERTRIVARAYHGDTEIIESLLALIEKETNPAWEATLLTLTAPWIPDERVKTIAQKSLDNDSPLVRSAAVRTLSLAGDNDARLREMIKDPVRMVRLDAAWALREHIDADQPVYRELKQYLDYNSDQPAGASLQGQFAYAQGRFDLAESWFRKSIKWDSHAAPLHENLAFLLNARGKREEAIEALQQAQELQPDDANYPFMIALIYADLGNLKQTESMLIKAVEVEPEFARAWYNLSLVYAQQNRLDAAITAIESAERLEPEAPDHPFVKATLFYRQGKIDEAIQAAEKALEINPNYIPAQRMLNTLSTQSP